MSPSKLSFHLYEDGIWWDEYFKPIEFHIHKNGCFLVGSPSLRRPSYFIQGWNWLFIKGIGPPQLVWKKDFDVFVFVVIISNLQDLNIFR
jgi:hypothetical protein